MIGLGGIATRSHLPALAAQSDVVISAGAEIDTYQANRTQKRFGIPKVYGTYQEMLDQEPLDAVYVCLPNSLHYQATKAALDLGLHVFCEKPMGLSAQEAGDLAEQAERSKLILMPGYHLRFHDHFLRARELLKDRRLGKILQVQASAIYSGPYRGWDPKSDWHLNPKSGGPLYDWGSHLIDLLLFITNLDLDFVYATAQKTLPGFPIMDNIAAVFQTHNNIVGTLNLAWGTRGNLLMLQIHGSAGSLIVSDDYYEHLTPTGGGLNKLGVLLGNSWEILNQKAGSIIRRRASDLTHIRATQSFIEAIQGKVQTKAAMWDAVRVHFVLAAIANSIEQDKPVKSDSLPVNVKQGEA